MTGGNTLGEVKVLTTGGESRGRVSFPFPRWRRRQSAHEAARATWWLAGDLFDTHDAPTYLFGGYGNGIKDRSFPRRVRYHAPGFSI
jgi:hypothetical protein